MAAATEDNLTYREAALTDAEEIFTIEVNTNTNTQPAHKPLLTGETKLLFPLMLICGPLPTPLHT